MTTAEATAVRLDLDLESGRISAPGRMLGASMLQPNLETLLQGEDESFAVIVLSKGDRRPVDLALVVDGVPREVDVLTIKAALKEFETGRRYDLHEGNGTGFLSVQRSGETRYRFMMALPAAQMRRILQSYSDPLGTFVDLIAEIETQCRYNPADYSPGSSSTHTVPLGSQTVEVPVPLVQSNGTRNYRLSVTGTPLPAASSGGWGALPLSVNNQSVNITVSGGNVVAQNLSISPSTRGTQAPATVFTPHWFTSMKPARIDPAPGGLILKIDVVTEAMSTLIFGAMPSTIWRAEKVEMRHLWSNGSYSYHAPLGPPDTFTFYDAPPVPGGNQDHFYMPTTYYSAPANVTLGMGNFTFFVSRGSTKFSDLIWKSAPVAQYVRTAVSSAVPIVAEPVPASPTIRFDVALVAQGASASNEIVRVSSQSFVVRLRRDLIPDVSPDSGGS
ncbi:MAG TPA: hypothetical protein PLA50_04795 [Bacteroidia bacterium]|nr:hypothetical protein [Bacteroidia bacterium]